MNVLSFLAMLRERDIRVWADGDRLRCSAPAGVLTPEFRDELQLRKKEILEFLCSAGALAQQQRAIVPLQPRGERLPVFAVAGHNGDVFCYRAFAQCLGGDQPFYGLQPPGLDGQGGPLESVEDLAAYFAAQIRAFHPDGPFIIAGFCAGGSIAFELARQLLGARAAVSFLALFGCPYPTSYRRLSQLRRLIAYHVKRVVRHARELASGPSGERWGRLAEKLRNHKARRAAGRPAAPDPVLLLRAKVEDATIAALRRYTPGHFAGRVSLFLPSREWVRQGNESLRWRSVARHTEECYGPDGCHVDVMLRESYAPVFAGLFRQRCARTAQYAFESPLPGHSPGERQLNRSGLRFARAFGRSTHE